MCCSGHTGLFLEAHLSSIPHPWMEGVVIRLELCLGSCFPLVFPLMKGGRRRKASWGLGDMVGVELRPVLKTPDKGPRHLLLPV